MHACIQMHTYLHACKRRVSVHAYISGMCTCTPNTHTHTHTCMHTQVVGTVLQVSLQAVRAVTTPLLSRMTAWSLLPRSLQTLLLGGGAQGYVNPVLAASVALKFKRFTYICVYMYDTYVIYVYIYMCICV